MDPYGISLRKIGVPVLEIPRMGHFDLGRLRKLRNQIRDKGVSIVHCFLNEANIYGYLASRFAVGIRLITSVRSTETPRGFFREKFARRALKSSDLVIANSEAASRFAIGQFRVETEKIRIVYNGINSEVYDGSEGGFQVRRDLGIPEDAFVIGSVGRLEEVKNFSLLLKVISRLKGDFPGVRLILAGDGSLLDDLRKYSVRLGIDSTVHFLGARNDIPAVLAAMNVFTLTSIRESFPNVLMEAMAAGLPVVSTNVGGCEELVNNGVSGFLVESPWEEGLESVFRSLLKDSVLRSQLGTSARMVIREKFSTEKMVQKLGSFYGDLLVCNDSG
jgi:glycosyltransferase involved in cell wall biosynthesis